VKPDPRKFSERLTVTQKLRWGFLGAGGIAPTIATDFQIAGITIQAVATRDLVRSNTFADKFGIPNRYDSYATLVADPEVDIVYVSTTQNFHHRDALMVINAGKHLLLEKPFTLDAEEAAEIQAAALEMKVFVMEAMWTRFLPTMVEVFTLLEQGVIGDPRIVYADHSQHLLPKRAPRLWNPALGGGALLDLGIYPVSFAARVLGLPSEVVARSTLTEQGIDEITSMIFRYDNGAHAILETSMVTAGPVSATIHGTQGRIEIDRPFYEQTSFTVFDLNSSVVQRYEEKIDGRGMQYQAVHVEECIQAGLLESPIMTLSESVSLMKLMDEMRSQTGITYTQS